MPTVPAEKLEKLAADILRAAGATDNEAGIVSRHLIEASLAGHDSHGMMRVLQYTEDIRSGSIVPGTEIKTIQDWDTGSTIDATGVFGQVACNQAMQMAIRKARERTVGVVTIRGAHHSGRLGAYVAQAAAEDMIGVVMVNGGGAGQWVAPFGGRERRIGTNPIAIGAPSGKGFPIVLDMGTSIVPEGKIRHYFQKGETVPDGWLIDHAGKPTNDPGVLYAEPPGAILPLGGSSGHKGYGLAFFVDILAGILSGAGCCGTETPQTSSGGGILMLAIKIGSFGPTSQFQQHVSTLVDHVKSSAPVPGFKEVLVPGEFEFQKTQRRSRDGVDVADSVWKDLNALLVELQQGS
jgi:uncharacterized oxidoreductase